MCDVRRARFLPGSARGQSAARCGKKFVQLWQSELYIHCAVQQRQRCGFVTVKMTLPYLKAEYRDNEKDYLNYYDEVEVCKESSAAHYKSAIQVRNRSLVDRSDLVICCIQHDYGGAYATVKYAEKCGKRIVNLNDEVTH